jgi:hypothetical protein
VGERDPNQGLVRGEFSFGSLAPGGGEGRVRGSVIGRARP